MRDADKTREQLMDELHALRQRVSDLESNGEREVQPQELLDALPFYVLLIDSDHNIIMANKAIELQLGLKPDDIVGGYCPKVVHGADQVHANCPLEESVRNKCAVEQEYFDTKYNKWLSSAIYPIERKLKKDRPAYFHMLYDITARKKAEEELKQSIEKIKKVTDSIVTAAAITIEKRDPYTSGHQQRVSKLACEIAKIMGVTKEQLEGVHVAGLLHDIGKIGIPIELLSKPGKLSKYEFNLIKEHPQIGYEILNGIEFSYPIAEIILQHHERINGSGYPRSLFSKDILFEAKILSVADVVEAMCSHRPYRPSLSVTDALQEISRNSGILYDLGVVDACLKLFTEKNYKFE